MTRHFNLIKLTLITIVILFILYLNVFESDQHFENVFWKNKNTTVITTSADSNELECLHTQKQRQKRIQEYCAQNRVSKE